MAEFNCWVKPVNEVVTEALSTGGILSMSILIVVVMCCHRWFTLYLNRIGSR